MPTRLPDATFTTNTTLGFIPMEGVIQPGPTFKQGEDIGLTVYLTLNGLPLGLENYTLTFLLKKDERAQNTIFRQYIVSRVSDVEGYYGITIPSAVSSKLRPGTYYYTFVAVKRHTMETSEVYRGTLNIEVGVGSPNPNLPVVGEEVTADGDSVSMGGTNPSAEVTGPHSPDLTFPG